ncbi:MAG TPA: hypothetical protein PLI09_27470 [Candidatus Hydrogenedentes bacterium]|nr:hypothetical protein [Candidatus Hydrogenedentota bacterium]
MMMLIRYFKQLAASFWFFCIMIFCSQAWSTGWSDFSFDIDARYMVLSSNSQDVQIFRKAGEYGIETVLPIGHDPVWELCTAGDFLLVKSIPYWIIDRKKDLLLGPLRKADFDKKLVELGVKDSLEWKNVHDTYRQALREGRADKRDVDYGLLCAAIMIAFISPVMLGVCLLLAVLITLFIRYITHSKWIYPKTLAWSFIVTTMIVFGMITAPVLWYWFSMRFL